MEGVALQEKMIIKKKSKSVFILFKNILKKTLLLSCVEPLPFTLGPPGLFLHKGDFLNLLADIGMGKYIFGTLVHSTLPHSYDTAKKGQLCLCQHQVYAAWAPKKAIGKKK